MRLLSLALIGLLSGCALSTTGKVLNVGIAAASAGDYLTTRAAINSGKGVEANPLAGQGPIRQFLLKAGLVGGIVWITHWSDEQERTRLATIVRLLAIAWNTGLAVHNYRVIR